MLLSIITLNYKTPEKTLECIECVYEHFVSEFENSKFEYIIIDNASGDDSSERIKTGIKKAGFNNVHFIQNKENAGFGKGCNLGSEYSKGDYLLFLNSDTRTLDRSYLEMIEFLSSHAKAGIIGGQMRNIDGSLQVSASKFYTLGNLFLMLLGSERLGLSNKNQKETSEVDWVSGGCLLIKRAVFEEIGKFDPNLFMYMEDMELCFRAKKCGFLTYIYPNSNIVHASQGSSNRSFAIVNIYKGIRYFYRKYFPGWQYTVANILLASKAVILVIIGRVTKNRYLYETYAKAFKFY